MAGGGELALDLPLDLGAQPEQPGLGRHELLADLLEPGGMGEVAGPDDGDPLPARPQGEMLQIRVPAGGPGVLRVDVEIGVEAHGGLNKEQEQSTLSPTFCPSVSYGERAS